MAGVLGPGTTRDLLTRTGVVFGGTALEDARSVEPPTGPPGRRAGLGELTAPWQLARLLGGAPRLATVPRGDGRIVLDVPGWRASERTGLPLRRYLRWLGWDARGWGLGVNRGFPETDTPALAEGVLILAEQQGGPVSLVGWSLGGVIAREVAREHPDAVDRVITYGTPVVGGPTYTLGATTYGEEECARIEALIAGLDTDQPIRTPITAMFTRRDGVVDWRSCVDHTSPDVEHVEVGSSHLGLGVDPDVWEVVARRLAH